MLICHVSSTRSRRKRKTRRSDDGSNAIGSLSIDVVTNTLLSGPSSTTATSFHAPFPKPVDTVILSHRQQVKELEIRFLVVVGDVVRGIDADQVAADDDAFVLAEAWSNLRKSRTGLGTQSCMRKDRIDIAVLDSLVDLFGDLAKGLIVDLAGTLNVRSLRCGWRGRSGGRVCGAVGSMAIVAVAASAVVAGVSVAAGESSPSSQAMANASNPNVSRARMSLISFP